MGKTKLKIKLDKPYYVAGQMIQGVIMLKNEKPILLDKVYIKMKGVEKIKWEEHWETYDRNDEGEVVHTHKHSADYDEKETFFKTKVKITGKDAELPPGKWSFPFSVQLPLVGKKGNKLTGSFKLKEDNTWDWGNAKGRVEDLKAKIEYSMKACVDLDWAKDLEKKQDIVIYEQLLSAIPLPHDKKEANVMVCFCCDKGSCSVEATLGKNFYCSGEMAEAICTIRNDSTKEVIAAAELNRLLRLKADGHTIFDKDMIKLGRFDTVMPGETKEIKMAFQIPKALPSTDGHYIDCAYVMDILAEISMAPDIECHFPVSIMVPPIEYQPDPEEDESSYEVQEPCVVEAMAVAIHIGASGTVISSGGGPQATVAGTGAGMNAGLLG